MNRVEAFVDSQTTSSPLTVTIYPSRSTYHKKNHGFLRAPRTIVSSRAPHRLAVANNLFLGAESLLLSEAPFPPGSYVTTAPEFSAEIDPSASSAFLLIMVVFGALKLRADSISSVAKDRKALAVELKAARIRRITGEDGIVKDGVVSYAVAELAYRDALDREDRLREVLPGIRVVSPTASLDEMRKESRELLPDLKLRDGEEVDNGDSQQLKPGFSMERKGGDDASQDSGTSVGQILILAIVGLSQIALLFMLSFDPMQASIFSSWH